jgi:poly-gamma-glutamate synthesis protein (capsule biosynthesis protein)
MVNKKGQPEILKHDERGQEVFDYMDKITRGAGLNARYEWEEDEVVIYAD